MVFPGFICGDCLALVSGQSVSHISSVGLCDFIFELVAVFDCKAAPFLGCCVHLGVLGTQVAVLHRAHTSGFCSASQQLFSAQRGIAVALGRCVLRYQAWHLVSLGTLVKCPAPWANRVAERMTGERLEDLDVGLRVRSSQNNPHVPCRVTVHGVSMGIISQFLFNSRQFL
jgi:hypothetical protein